MFTPTTRTRASAGFISTAANIQRSERQNHVAVVFASNPAAVIGTVATNTMITACRKSICSRKPMAAGSTPNSAIMPSSSARALASIELSSSGLSEKPRLGWSRMVRKFSAASPRCRSSTVSPSAAPTSAPTTPRVSAVATP
jgi:hypothetical protein